MAKDPFQYFRVEARELLEKLSRGAMALERGQVSKALIADLLRLAHTLKGAARVVKQVEMADLAHAMEEVLTPHREAAAPVPPDQAADLLRLVDGCEERFKALLPAEQRASAPAAPPPEEAVTSVRVDVAEMDALLADLTQASVHLRAFDAESAALDRLSRSSEDLLDRIPGPLRSLAEEVRSGIRQCRRSFQARLEKAQRDFAALCERASDLRLLHARTIVPFLERAVRDSAESQKTRVAFDVEGGEHRLDAHVLLAVRDALLHVVRNAVAHGIEPAAQRAAAGKPPTGRVRLRVHKRGQRVSFVVEDDGRGLDLTAIGRRAVGQGLLTAAAAEALDPAEAAQLLLRGGLTTSPAVSDVSGRGVGLDVVRATAVRLRGTVSLSGEPGKGLAVELVVPVSLESMSAVGVVAGDSAVLVPFTAVLRVLRLPEKELVSSPGGTSLILDDQAIPFQPLEQLLGSTRPRRSAARTWTVVVLQAGALRAAIGVDRLAGIRDVLIRPLPALCGAVPLIAGAVLNEEGDPQLVLDPAAAVSRLHAVAEPTPMVAPRQRPPLLVVDDSLTTRMLEQSILEAAGYPVDLATSGEEAIEKARAKKYAVFIVDVEMPGMNGFELLERFRADPQQRDVPAIMVTSRNAREDRLRGQQVGARAYIVKSEFHEGHLLRTIQELVGEGGT